MNCRLQVVLRISWGYVVLHANKVYKNIKNRTVCFQERFRLLSLATVLRKYPSWFQNPINIVFWNRNVYFLRTGRSQNPENKSVLFFIYPRPCSMQYSCYENPSIQVSSELLLYRDHIYLISIFRAQCFSPAEHPLKRILLCFQKFGFFTA